MIEDKIIEKRMPIWMWGILVLIMFGIGFWFGNVGKRKGWEHLDPKDRFVPYYVQKSQGIKFVVVRDDVMGKEYLVVKTSYGVGIVSIK